MRRCVEPTGPVVELRVRDLERSLVVYVGVGFTVARCCGRAAVLAWQGEPVLRLVEDATLPPCAARGRAGLVVRTRGVDLDALRERARELGVQASCEAHALTLVDPDGFVVRWEDRG